MSRSLVLLVCCVLSSFAACAPKPKGPQEPVVAPPEPTGTPAEQKHAWRDAKRTFDQRCVVCHGCYDSPCQLTLSSYDGIERGASKAKVYDGARLLAIPPTRLHVDAHGAAEWRDKGFWAVLPEGEHGDPARALLTRMLELKREHPLLLDGGKLPRDFEIGLDRVEICAKSDEFDGYAKDHPSWGMPYALPGLAPPDHDALVNWVREGSPHEEPAKLSSALQENVARWEEFLNQQGNKEQLVARYMFEHLFLASLYFDGLDERVFFRLVRSRTPPGKEIEEVATRRPFDDPTIRPFYYRLLRRVDTVLSKTHMPYPLSDKRLKRYRELFIEPDYRVETLPDYHPTRAANPFATFSSLPVRARYRFMLEEAMFTMAGFIKGPVCRGQTALDVIEDRFWITFVNPDSPLVQREAELLAGESEDLSMPAEQGSNGLLITWRKYARREKNYLDAKSRWLSDIAQSPKDVNLSQIWDGDGRNENAALTVLRHFDSATVVKGLVGGEPKTAWVVGYALLERIHYLLVAGFDVFGNIGHQLHSRLYMDFLRMEGEFNFLTLLPKARRKPLMETWYRDTDQEVKDQVYGRVAHFDQESGIPYKDKVHPERELFVLLTEHVGKALNRHYGLGEEPNAKLREELTPVALAEGMAATLMPETSFLEVHLGNGQYAYFTILRDSAHTNVAHLFRESDRRRPLEDQLTVLRGFVGAYPNSLYSVEASDVPTFVGMVRGLNNSDAYDRLRERFGVRRTDARFWAYSDRIHTAFHELSPLEAGLFDYNRLDGR